MVDVAFAVGIVASGIRLSTPIIFAALGENIADNGGIHSIIINPIMYLHQRVFATRIKSCL